MLFLGRKDIGTSVVDDAAYPILKKVAAKVQ
jgi:hypothetical protein